MLTTEQIAEKLGLHYQVAYGFITFMKHIGAATSENPPKSGKKGKPSKLWRLTPNAAELCAQWLGELNKLADDEATLRTAALAERQRAYETDRAAKQAAAQAAREAAKQAAQAAKDAVAAQAAQGAPVVAEQTVTILDNQVTGNSEDPAIIAALADPSVTDQPAL